MNREATCRRRVYLMIQCDLPHAGASKRRVRSLCPPHLVPAGSRRRRRGTFQAKQARPPRDAEASHVAAEKVIGARERGGSADLSRASRKSHRRAGQGNPRAERKVSRLVGRVHVRDPGCHRFQSAAQREAAEQRKDPTPDSPSCLATTS
jgi:hypothetical protein